MPVPSNIPRARHPCCTSPSVLAYFESTLGWKEIARRTYREVMRDDAQGLAAQLSYYFFVSLFPALLCVIAIASFFPLQNFTDDMVRLLGPFCAGGDAGF